jgi:signal peptidase I
LRAAPLGHRRHDKKLRLAPGNCIGIHSVDTLGNNRLPASPVRTNATDADPSTARMWSRHTGPYPSDQTLNITNFISMPNKPKKWIAVLLGLVSPPIGMMYVAQIRLAAAYFFFLASFAMVSMLSSEWRASTVYLPLVLAVLGATHAYLLAKKYPDEKPRPTYSRWYGILGAAAGVVVLVVGVRAFFFEPFRAPSGSMLPTVPAGAGLIVQKWGYGNYGSYGMNLLRAPTSSAIHRGDIIVFEFPSNRSLNFVKRVVGLPGDKIAYRGKQLFINGVAAPLRPAGDYFNRESLDHTPRFVESLPGIEYSVLIHNEVSTFMRPPPFSLSERCTYDKEEISCEVPAGHFFTLGDNRDNSNDSRMWGFVPSDHLIGKVVFVGS